MRLKRQSKIIVKSKLVNKEQIVAVSLTSAAATHVSDFIANRGKGEGIRLGV